MRRETLGFFAIIGLFLLLQIVPFIYAQQAADGQHQFSGFLLNPSDGFSYLAKMRQGFDGAWSFTLPYTAQPGEGAAINLYYLFLGHVARWLGWSLIFTLHAARVWGALALCAALAALIRATLADQRIWTFALTLFASGVGWLVLLAGGFTSDFWVAEMYPFLASFANAHFPLGLALQVFVLTPSAQARPVAWLLAAALLAVVYPFGWAVALAVLSAQAVLLAVWRQVARVHWLQPATVLVGGLPFAAYALWVINTHPVLLGWNAQNLTPAMPLWDLAVSLAPALLLALPGALLAFRQHRASLAIFLVWLLVSILLLYAPFGLQRRMSSGLFIPCVALAVFSLSQLRSVSRRRLARMALLVMALPTNVFILLGAGQAVQRQEPALYLRTDQVAAYTWLGEQAAGALVMAPADNSLHLPAFANVRVWYGHPFETIQATQRQAEQADFFALPAARAAFLQAHPVQYILSDGQALSIQGWWPVFEQGSIQVLARE